MTLNAALWITGMTFAITAAIFVLINRSVDRRTAIGILRRMRTTGTSYTVKVGGTDGTWNPVGQRGNYRIFGPGTATYTLQTTDHGDVVHLTFTDNHGHTRHETGPVSERLQRITGPRGRARWQYSALTLGVGILAIFSVGGAVGLLATSGASQQARVIAMFAGMVCAWLLASIALLGAATWAGARQNRKDRERQHSAT